VSGSQEKIEEEEQFKMLLKDLEKRVQAIEDAESIKKLHQNYINLMDNLQYEAVLDLFTKDANVEIRNSGVKRGRQEISQLYIDGLAKHRGTSRREGHMAVEPDITVAGDMAKGTWLIYMLFSRPTVKWVQGKNECEYRKVNGSWKISQLKFSRTLASDPELYP
jgi:ketosteroid isomerase-like protein